MGSCATVVPSAVILNWQLFSGAVNSEVGGGCKMLIVFYLLPNMTTPAMISSTEGVCVVI